MASSAPISAPPARLAKAAVDPRVALGRRARLVLLFTAALTIALYTIPQLHHIAYPLMLISTVVHEMGHGMAAVISGGQWDSFHMYTDGSGYATTATAPGLAAAFVAAGGLVGPAVIGAIFLTMGRRPKLARWCLGLTGTFFALALILWVRGPFGLIFVGSLGLICLFVAIRARAEVAQVSLLFFATQLAMSVYSRSDYLFVKEAHGQMTGSTPMPSDVQNMASNLFGPYWLWGAVCAAFSAIVLLAAVWLYLRPMKSKIANPAPLKITI